jgi:hypothetical protein
MLVSTCDQKQGSSNDHTKTQNIIKITTAVARKLRRKNIIGKFCYTQTRPELNTYKYREEVFFFVFQISVTMNEFL